MKATDVSYPRKIEKMVKMFYQRLSEKDRRLFVAIEAERLGYGGVSFVSRFYGCSRPTVHKGIKEFQDTSALAPATRIREAGGGRKGAFCEHENLRSELDDILKDTIAGDPMNPGVRWTHLKARQIQQKLEGRGIVITTKTVRVLVKKTLGKAKSPKTESAPPVRKQG
jgi:hypothetical protein